ncbi:uncharacterized protein I206_104581 [Kwoniella pini CBS 10737]|uniref:Uncharacterized protein n=1 Tax=Kwoniella pini CBS 10737 TaxID=1296096 RepID=A0A1B9I7H3_9TREE|nr:uncharacterized protein I206_02115 [Kwoniella pini CBS 10737]OCF51401.1 hypothetical protein I206_02115 [Kwoniella pini CBS 10737]
MSDNSSSGLGLPLTMRDYTDLPVPINSHGEEATTVVNLSYIAESWRDYIKKYGIPESKSRNGQWYCDWSRYDPQLMTITKRLEDKFPNKRPDTIRNATLPYLTAISQIDGYLTLKPSEKASYVKMVNGKSGSKQLSQAYTDYQKSGEDILNIMTDRITKPDNLDLENPLFTLTTNINSNPCLAFWDEMKSKGEADRFINHRKVFQDLLSKATSAHGQSSGEQE